MDSLVGGAHWGLFRVSHPVDYCVGALVRAAVKTYDWSRPWEGLRFEAQRCLEGLGDDGPLDGLIEVEMMRPRKRKIARVVAAGVVEILTRPPQVGNLLETRRK